MADYYSLLSRAVLALPESDKSARQAVYDRARSALVKQLTSIHPPIPETDIKREQQALEGAILKLEAERNAPPRPKTAPPPPPVRAAKNIDDNQKYAGLRPALARLKDQVSKTTRKQFTGAQNLIIRPRAQQFEPLKPQNASEEHGLEDAGIKEVQRPAAPARLPPRAHRTSQQVSAVIGVLISLIIVVLFLAWKFHEGPEDQAGLNIQKRETEGAAGEFGKLGDRIEGGATSRSASNVPVAQKAEMWVGSLKEPDKVDRIYNASVMWRLDTVSGAPGEAVSQAIRGDVDVPEAKMKLSLLIRKNTDPTLSASHTINISFIVGADAPLGGVKAIGPLQLRRPDAQAGEKIVGIPVPISENYFLIGMMRGDREARNVALLRSQAIIDLPFQFNDGRIATINMEKGASGDRIFAEAIDSWGR